MIPEQITVELELHRGSPGAEFEALEQQYRQEVSAGIHQALERMSAHAAQASADNHICRLLCAETSEYVQWMTWALWDLPSLAAAVRPDFERFRRGVSACGFLYVAGRIFDDFLDRHFLYRGRRSTLSASLGDKLTPADGEALALVAALLMCFQAVSELCAEPKLLLQVSEHLRRMLAGIAMERSAPDAWGEDFYTRLVELKNVDYWRILYAAVDPDHHSPLYPFLTRYYALAQKINDAQDFTRDIAQGRPNLISVYPNQGEAVIEADFLHLLHAARSLPDVERFVAFSKLDETFAELRKLGLFAPAESAPAADAPRLGLIWHSRLDEFVDRLGPNCLEHTNCPICAGNRSSPLLLRQGFSLTRCAACAHVFVNPRLRSEVIERLGAELDGAFRDPYLDSQKLFAEHICRLLRRHTKGPRLLDIGFGAGDLLRMAHAYAFQVYGVDTSSALIESLSPAFGQRLHKVHAGDAPLPWGSFDAVVLSHVLEHIPNPIALLTRIHEALNESGLLYVAVPDLESVQFRIFGGRWDAINPVAHLQYFSESSLTRLAESAGFAVVGRVRHPPIQGRMQTRWMRLFRRLGGDETGELALLLRRVSPGPTHFG